MSGSAFSEWFEKLWTDREDRVYRSLFGHLGDNVHVAGEVVGRGHRRLLRPLGRRQKVGALEGLERGGGAGR